MRPASALGALLGLPLANLPQILDQFRVGSGPFFRRVDYRQGNGERVERILKVREVCSRFILERGITEVLQAPAIAHWHKRGGDSMHLALQLTDCRHQVRIGGRFLIPSRLFHERLSRVPRIGQPIAARPHKARHRLTERIMPGNASHVKSIFIVGSPLSSRIQFDASRIRQERGYHRSMWVEHGKLVDTVRGRSARLRLHTADVQLLEKIAVTAVLPSATRHHLASLSLSGLYPAREVVEWKQFGGVVLAVVTSAIEIAILTREGTEIAVLQLGASQLTELDEGGWAMPDTTTVTVMSAPATFVLMPSPEFLSAVFDSEPAFRLWHEEQRRCRLALGRLAARGLHVNPDIRIDHVIWEATRRLPPEGVKLPQVEIARLAKTDEARVSNRMTYLKERGVVRVIRSEHRIFTLDLDALNHGR